MWDLFAFECSSLATDKIINDYLKISKYFLKVFLGYLCAYITALHTLDTYKAQSIFAQPLFERQIYKEVILLTFTQIQSGIPLCIAIFALPLSGRAFASEFFAVIV